MLSGKKFFQSVNVWLLSAETVSAPVCCMSRTYSKWKLRSGTELTAISYYMGQQKYWTVSFTAVLSFQYVFVSKPDGLTSAHTRVREINMVVFIHWLRIWFFSPPCNTSLFWVWTETSERQTRPLYQWRSAFPFLSLKEEGFGYIKSLGGGKYRRSEPKQLKSWNPIEAVWEAGGGRDL